MDQERLYDGYCEFCGQVVQYDGAALQEAKGDKRIAAKLICDCAQAEIYRRRRKNILDGAARVDKIVGKYSDNPASDEVVSYLHRAVTHIVNRDMKKVTVQVSNVEKVTVAATKKESKFQGRSKRPEIPKSKCCYS